MGTPLDLGARLPDKPPHGREAVYKFAEFDPNHHIRSDGTLAPMWEAAWITRMGLPRPLPYLEGIEVTRVAVHRKVAPGLLKALIEIDRAGLWEFLAPYGGGFNFRRVRGGSALSMHSLGLALDFAPDENPMGMDPNETKFGRSGEGRAVVRLLELYGWLWGGRFSRPDAMHFQYATGC
jgi:hypothetical protein